VFKRQTICFYLRFVIELFAFPIHNMKKSPVFATTGVEHARTTVFFFVVDLFLEILPEGCCWCTCFWPSWFRSGVVQTKHNKI